MATSALDPPVEPGKDRGALARGCRARVLVVDDERRLAETFRLALRDEHDVTIVHSGREALDLILGDPAFDVVLCDLMVPDLPGPEIYDRVVAENPERARRFVFITGGAYTPAARAFLERVGNPRLEKPFPLSEIARLIAELTGGVPVNPEA